MEEGGDFTEAGDEFQHPEALKNENPQILYDTFHVVTGFLQAYGWFVVFGIGLLFFLKSRLQPLMDKKRQQWEDARHHKDQDTDQILAREQGLAAARARLQAQHDEQIKDFAEKQKQREEEKRKAKIEGWNRYQEGKGYRSPLKGASNDSDEASTSSSTIKSKRKPVYRTSDYNPLMGNGGRGSCFRPPRRGGASGGG